MSRLAALLEDFALPAPVRSEAPDAATAAEIEARELQTFDQGYRAGWDDAVKAQSEDHERLSSDFAQNLKDLSFTYHEAYSHVLKAMSPLLEAIVDQLLPAAFEDGIGSHLVSELQARGTELGEMRVEIAVAPEQLALVEPVIARDVGFPVALVPDAALSEGQADLRFGDREDRVDLTEIADRLRSAVDGFNACNQGHAKHG